MRPSLHPLALALFLAAGCGSSPSSEPDAAPPTANQNLAVVRVESWPAGGRELTVRANDNDGAPLAGDLSNELALSWMDGSTVDFIASPVSLEPGYSAVLIAPAATETARTEQVAALRAFIAARPASERIALYRWGTNVDQITTFTHDRERLAQLADLIKTTTPDSDPLSAFAAVGLVGAEVSAIDGEAPRTMRSLIVLGGTEPADLSGMPVSVAPVVWVPAGVAATDGITDAASRIDALAMNAYYTIALCGSTAEVTVSISAGTGTPLSVPLPATLPEQTMGTCAPAAIGAGKRSYTERIELVFTSAERSVYDDRVAANSKADFDVSLRLAPGEDLVVAVAHLRGAGSLACRRRSYTIDIDGPRPRYLMPGSATDEIYLLSMCPDDRYVNQYTANQLMAEHGMWPIKVRYVEVVLDGVTQGVYLMLEKVREELVSGDARVRTVLRRRFNPPDDFTELKWERPDVSGVQALETWIADLQGKSGTALVTAAESATDLDAYLRFIAMQTLLGNGDYVDETWWWSTDELAPDGSLRDRFAVMAWDADDLFSPCHYGGAHAVVDPNQLVFCAEARMDHVFIGDPLVYERYVTVLEALLAALTPARFAAAIQKTDDDITPYLAKPGLCTAMIRLFEANPLVSDPAQCQTDVRAKLSSMSQSFATRHADLLSKAAAYRSSQ